MLNIFYAKAGLTSTTLLCKGHVFVQNRVCQFSLSTISFTNHIQRKEQLLIPNFCLTFSEFVIFKIYVFNSSK